MNIVHSITEILADKYDIAEDRVLPTTGFDSLDLDSLALAEISVVLTSRLGIFVSDDELADAATVGEAAKRLTDRLASVGAEV